MKSSRANVFITTSTAIIFILLLITLNQSAKVSASQKSEASEVVYYETISNDTATATATATTTSPLVDEDELTSTTTQETPTRENNQDEPPDEPICGARHSRLPNQTIPQHYDLIIMPDLNLLTFQGAVQIGVKILLKTNQIVLHAHESLTVGEAWYLNRGQSNSALLNYNNNNNKTITNNLDVDLGNDDDDYGNYLQIKSVCRDEQQSLVFINFAKELPPNSFGQLHFSFAGYLSDDLRGFYKSSYININESSRRFHGVTQFQATEARRVFPCFDEPALKATFDLTLITTPIDRRTILANTKPIFDRILKEDKQKDLPERRLVRFARTPLMSTYLLAFVVGEFDYLERVVNLTSNLNTKERKLRIRVYTPLGKSERGKFALEVASRAMASLEEYSNIPYPLQKLDLISVPDFEAGAMENWGLITFKEQQLLIDDENSSFDSKALIAGTIIHELAHQWFGNLVTMKWWNDLWLNEGFATWMEYKLTGELYPHFEYNYYYLLNSHIHAMNEDSYRQVHPVEVQYDLEEVQDIDELFDAISYNKAAALIKLLPDDSMMKDLPFKEAIQDYLKSFMFKNSIMKDLWQAMEARQKGGELRVAELMESWITQPGHPLIRISSNNETSNELQFEQERFVTGVKNLTEEEMKQVWRIPITIIISNLETNRTELISFKMEERKASLKLPEWFSLNGDDDNFWFKLNANFTGFYRVLYPLEYMKRMRRAIELKLMAPADRLNLLDEAHTLLIGNKLPSSQLVQLLSWFSNEDHGAVIEVLVGAFNGLLKIYEYHPKLSGKLKQFGRLLLGKVFKNCQIKLMDYGTTGTTTVNTTTSLSLIDSLGRSSLLSTLIYLNDTELVSKARQLFDLNIDKRINPIEFRKPIYVAISRYGSERQFERLFKLFNETESRDERIRLAQSMAKANQFKRLNRTYEWLKELSQDQLEDRFEILSHMLDSSSGRSFIGRELLLESRNFKELIELNNEKPINGLVEELSLSLDQAGEFLLQQAVNQLYKRHKNSSEWMSSHQYVRRMLAWQASLQAESGAIRMEKELDSILTSLPV